MARNHQVWANWVLKAGGNYDILNVNGGWSMVVIDFDEAQPLIDVLSQAAADLEADTDGRAGD
jgi:hypothetical protein